MNIYLPHGVAVFSGIKSMTNLMSRKVNMLNDISIDEERNCYECRSENNICPAPPCHKSKLHVDNFHMIQK